MPGIQRAVDDASTPLDFLRLFQIPDTYIPDHFYSCPINQT